MQTWAAGDSSALPFGFYVVTLSRIVREWPGDGQSESLPVSTREAWTPQAPGSLTGVPAWQTPTQLMSQNHEVENGARARLPAIQAEQSKRNERRPQWQFSRTAVNFPANRCSSGPILRRNGQRKCLLLGVPFLPGRPGPLGARGRLADAPPFSGF